MEDKELTLLRIQARERRTESLKALDETLKELREQLLLLKDTLVLHEKMVFSNQEVILMFDATSATIKKWRDEGLLGYSQIGSKIYYSSQDLSDFMKNTHIEAFQFEGKFAKQSKGGGWRG